MIKNAKKELYLFIFKELCKINFAQAFFHRHPHHSGNPYLPTQTILQSFAYMATYQLNINNKKVEVEALPDTPLLWVLRDKLALTGTKYGCGKALCGACTVHLEGNPIRSCSMPISAMEGKSITTIEGVGAEELHPVQKAWIAEDVPQCGFCQSGQIMSAIALLEKNPNPTDDDIDAAMAGNICRCGTYVRIRRAIKSAAQHA